MFGWIITILCWLYFTISTASNDFDERFVTWKVQYNKNYNDDIQESNAFNNWKTNLQIVNEQNNNPNNKYTLAMNQFSDLSISEFKHKYTSIYFKNSSMKSSSNPQINIKDLPDSIDWSNETGPVMNQGQEGSSAIITVLQCLQSFYKIYQNESEELSEQELIDCIPSIGPISVDQCWEFIVKNSGLCTEKDYPYKGEKGPCKKSSCTPIDPISSYIDVDAIGNATMLQYALLNGPIVVGVDASNMELYSNGVFNGPCGDSIDHMMLLVGYGVTESGDKYWKLKNSWGESWGMNGYILVCRECKDDVDGECGILEMPSYPVLPSSFD